MAWVVQHYIPLAGGAAWDPDPTLTQPGEFALDGDAAPLPITVSRAGGRVWAQLVVVDDAGAPQPADTETFDVKIAKRTRVPVTPAAGTVPTPRFVWGGGGTAAAQPPGSEVVQDQVEGPTLFVAVVTGGANPPASGRLAVMTWKDPR